MPELMPIMPNTIPHSHTRPMLVSFDSGEECSLTHWMEVCKLVDEADVPDPHEGMELTPELERAIEETMLEVEPATAYQHFTGDVV